MDIKGEVFDRHLEEAKYILNVTIWGLFMPLYPAFLILDYIYFQDIFLVCVLIRSITVSLALGIHFISRKLKSPSGFQICLLALSFISANSLLMVNWLGGPILENFYWVGVSVIASAVLPFFPWDRKYYLWATVVLYFPLLVLILNEANTHSQWKEVLAITMFSLSFAIVGIVCNHFTEFIRRKSTANHLKLQEIEMDRILDEQKNAALYSAKMASIGETAANIAHEINNPLTVIAGYCHQLSTRDMFKTNPDQANRYIAKISSNVDRISKIINGIKRFAFGKNDVTRKSISIPALLSEVHEICRSRLVAVDVKLKIDLTNAANAEIICNEVQILQVLVNLINNAVDAVTPLKDRWVSVEVNSNPKGMEISVTDSGHGIPEVIQEKMMDAFFTTKPIGKGTGLGLSISKRIVEQHYGELYYDKTNPNTRFVLILPLAISQAA